MCLEATNQWRAGVGGGGDNSVKSDKVRCIPVLPSSIAGSCFNVSVLRYSIAMQLVAFISYYNQLTEQLFELHLELSSMVTGIVKVEQVTINELFQVG